MALIYTLNVKGLSLWGRADILRKLKFFKCRELSNNVLSYDVSNLLKL